MVALTIPKAEEGWEVVEKKQSIITSKEKSRRWKEVHAREEEDRRRKRREEEAKKEALKKAAQEAYPKFWQSNVGQAIDLGQIDGFKPMLIVHATLRIIINSRFVVIAPSRGLVRRHSLWLRIMTTTWTTMISCTTPRMRGRISPSPRRTPTSRRRTKPTRPRTKHYLVQSISSVHSSF